MFFDLMTGRAQDTRGWFTPVRAGAPAAAPAAGPAKR
jgi:hypothetical protein